jgi:hypothetical protein
MKKLSLIIEKGGNGLLWGRVKYKNSLLVEKGSSVNSLESRMKKLLADFHDLESDKIYFDVAYDLTVLFEQMNFLNISGIAKMANINSSLLRQYAAGLKFPSPEKASEIERVIRDIGRELSNIKISSRSKNIEQGARKKIEHKIE